MTKKFRAGVCIFFILMFSLVTSMTNTVSPKISETANVVEAQSTYTNNTAEQFRFCVDTGEPVYQNVTFEEKLELLGFPKNPFNHTFPENAIYYDDGSIYVPPTPQNTTCEDDPTVYVYLLVDQETMKHYDEILDEMYGAHPPVTWKDVYAWAGELVEMGTYPFIMEYNINYEVVMYRNWNAPDMTLQDLLRHAQTQASGLWGDSDWGRTTMTTIYDCLAIITGYPVQGRVCGVSEGIGFRWDPFSASWVPQFIGAPGDAFVITTRACDYYSLYGIVQHEASHNYGCDDPPEGGGNHPDVECIMVYHWIDYTIEWCQDCKNMINSHINHFGRPTIPSISGPTQVYIGTTYTYYASAIDYDGDRLYYLFDWFDGTSTTVGPYNSGETASASHSWSQHATMYHTIINHAFIVRAIDSTGAFRQGEFGVATINRSPNVPSTPSGSASVYKNVWYTYSTSATEPDNDRLRYEFELSGPGTNITIITPVDSGDDWPWDEWYCSGETATINIKWNSTNPYGTYSIRVRAQDEWGLWSGWSQSLIVTLTETTPPTNPTGWSGSHSIRTWSSDNTVYVEWWGASDDDSGVYGYSYAWSTSPSTIPDTTVDTTGTSATSPALADGNSWYFHIRTVDNAGNWNPGAFHVGPFYIDATAPSTSISSPQNNQIVSGTVTITASASDSTSGIQKVEFYIDGKLKETDTDSPYQFSWDTSLETTTTTARHTIMAIAYDKVGNSAYDERTVWIDRHDVAVTGLNAFFGPPWMDYPLHGLGQVYASWGILHVEVRVENQGAYTENVSVSANYTVTIDPVVGTKTVTLAPGESAVLTFEWNLTEVDWRLTREYIADWLNQRMGTNRTFEEFRVAYVVSGFTLGTTINIAANETDLADNTMALNPVTTRLTGDANGDGYVDQADLDMVNAAYGGHWTPDPQWSEGYDWRCDFNGDGTINQTDKDILMENLGNNFWTLII